MRYGSSGKEKSRVLILRIGHFIPQSVPCKSENLASMILLEKSLVAHCVLCPHWDTDAVNEVRVSLSPTASSFLSREKSGEDKEPLQDIEVHCGPVCFSALHSGAGSIPISAQFLTLHHGRQVGLL